MSLRKTLRLLPAMYLRLSILRNKQNARSTIMEHTHQPNILDDRRIKLLNFLLKNHVIPEQGDFNLKDLITKIPAEEYNELFRDNKEFDGVWKNVDMPKSLTNFLIENDLAKKHGDNLQLTQARGRDLQK